MAVKKKRNVAKPQAKKKATKKAVKNQNKKMTKIAKKVVKPKPVAKPTKSVEVGESIKPKTVEINARGIYSPYDNEKYEQYLSHLEDLRRDGENKVNALRGEIRDFKLNKQIDRASKKTLIADNRSELNKARSVAKDNHHAVHEIISTANRSSKKEFKEYFSLVKKKKKEEIITAKRFYHSMVKNFKNSHKSKLKEIKQNYKKALESAQNKEAIKTIKADYKVNLKTENIAYAARLNEAKTARNEAIDSAKQFKYDSFMNKYGFSAKLRNDKHPISEWFQFKKETYVANFNFKNWIIKNALYIVILFTFVALVLVAFLGQGKMLLSGDSIIVALQQISPKIFFSLGVAGLILLGGTDLSIGRLTGIGVSFSLMLLSTVTYPDNNGVIWFNIVGFAPAAKVIIALLISIIFCTAFTTFAGFFTAKFKMHPFISTLAVQLISYGLFQLFWSATSSFSPDSSIRDMLVGNNGVLLIVYAIVAICIVWFIWNKTKFGKHMYAVGGNQEAATVSGINPFTITLLAFVMAGILYGFGGFVQAIQTGTGNFNSGYGTETDAIAACVIGGVSFSGGVGKIGGVVLGTIILGFLTHAFNFIGVNANLQLFIKGIIILVAVALDCVKYLRKR